MFRRRGRNADWLRIKTEINNQLFGRAGNATKVGVSRTHVGVVELDGLGCGFRKLFFGHGKWVRVKTCLENLPRTATKPRKDRSVVRSIDRFPPVFQYGASVTTSCDEDSQQKCTATHYRENAVFHFYLVLSSLGKPMVCEVNRSISRRFMNC